MAHFVLLYSTYILYDIIASNLSPFQNLFTSIIIDNGKVDQKIMIIPAFAHTFAIHRTYNLHAGTRVFVFTDNVKHLTRAQ